VEKVRIGIVGLGGMGSEHAEYLIANKVLGAELTAVCDIAQERLEWAKSNLGEEVALFDHVDQLLNSNRVDAIMVATPHYDHPRIAISALEKGLHVLIEKPAGVYTKQVRLMNEAAAQSDKVFGIMYNQRTNPLYAKLRELIDAGELGEIRRTNWIVTNWYRSQSYYDSGGWRATWAGEGGGVLINQDPHQLDLWQWTTGLMPARVRAFCQFGKYHDIEVEDDVTAYVEYVNGATGVFVTTTGEAPGTNRFEVTGDRGKIVVEDNKLTFWRLRMPVSEFNRTYKGGFGEPEHWKFDIPVASNSNEHMTITQNWVEAIIHGTPLLAPGQDGIKGLTLSNAMLLSSWTDSWVDLPIDEQLFYELLQEKISDSKVKRNKQAHQTLNPKGTF
jgi:predicted dehydrogenase